MKTAVVAEGLKASPPVTVTVVAWLNGLTINDLVGRATLAYIILQAAYLVWKWWREWKASRK